VSYSLAMSFTASLLAFALAASPEPVAHAVAGTKTVTVVRGGKNLPIAVDMALLRTDLLKVPLHGFLLVKVDKNGLVVRIDDDLELRVSDIAVLDAEKRAESSLSDQVNQLLTPEERGQRGTARMVGWFVSPTAANVPTSVSAKDISLKKAPHAPDEEPPRPKEIAAAVAPSPPAPALPLAAAPVPEVNGPERAGSTEQKAEPRARSEELPRQDAAPGASSAPGKVVSSPPAVDPGLRACVDALVAPLSAAVRAKLGPTLSVQARRSDGVVRVFLEGALPVDACFQSWAEAQASLSRKWTSFEVPLQ